MDRFIAKSCRQVVGAGLQEGCDIVLINIVANVWLPKKAISSREGGMSVIEICQSNSTVSRFSEGDKFRHVLLARADVPGRDRPERGNHDKDEPSAIEESWRHN